MSESRIHLLGNGISPKQKAKFEAQNVTLGEVAAQFQTEREENEKMVKWYMHQVPGLVERMVHDAVAGALMAAGIAIPVTPQPPESPVASPEVPENAGEYHPLAVAESPPPVTSPSLHPELERL